MITPDHPVITSSDHPQDDVTASDTAKGDQVITKNSHFKNSEEEKNLEPKPRSSDHLCLEAPHSKESGGDHRGDQEVITP
ncbi:hypothetical protein VB711_24050 [Cronbergia sp. UHCC 0137]|uniref:hypothetical protein n=1 Tax=Cronbergia sp. UHCC 0137 TaxID=3110239 RepID=UPI002B21857B|nr:hypothetical protein [Cronbergia sp. UHCC 0137]MEA5620886.1 hypothetical protein [Cronbergia sp. UHCC 0137]